MTEQEMRLDLALSKLSREWDFIVKVEVLPEDTFVAAVKEAVEAYRAALKAKSALASLPYVIEEIGR
jgi:tRNA(Ser,Leu) C12 N-acetylase TAN1